METSVEGSNRLTEEWMEICLMPMFPTLSMGDAEEWSIERRVVRSESGGRGDGGGELGAGDVVPFYYSGQARRERVSWGWDARCPRWRGCPARPCPWVPTRGTATRDGLTTNGTEGRGGGVRAEEAGLRPAPT